MRSFVAGPRVVTVDGVEIATYDLGGEGPPLLLAHATGFHGRVWLPLAAALGGRFRCWSFDSRGHGDSGRAPEGNYEWEGFGRDVAAVVAGLGLAGGGLRGMGHSAGGATLLLAEEAQPGSFAAVYCYEPVVPPTEAPGLDVPPDNPMADGARRRREVFASRAEARENYAGKLPFRVFDPDALDAYVEFGFHDRDDGTVELACRREDEARVYERAWHHGAFRDLGRVSCPVAISSGGRDAHFGTDFSRTIAARLGGESSIEVHPELGHFGPLEQPAGVARSIIDAFDAFDAFDASG